MTTQTEALKLALEALKQIDAAMPFPVAKLAIKKAEEALAQPEQDKERCVGCEACIDTACGRDECPKGWPKAPQRTWVGLTGGEVLDVLVSVDKETVRLPSMLGIFARAIEAKLKEKNT